MTFKLRKALKKMTKFFKINFKTIPWELFIGALCSCTIVLMLMKFQFIPLNNFLYNLQLKLKSQKIQSEPIVLLSLNNILDPTSNLDVKKFYSLLKKIYESSPSSVTYFTNLHLIQSKSYIEEFIGSHKEKEDLENLLQHHPLYIAINDFLYEGNYTTPELPWPLSVGILSEAPIPYENPGEKAFFVKRYMYSINSRLLHIPMLLSKNGMNNQDPTHLISHGETRQGYINFNSQGSYNVLSIKDLLEKLKKNPNWLNQKHIFMATTTNENIADHLVTPVSDVPITSPYAMTSLEVYANIVDNLQFNQSLTVSQKTIPILMAFIVTGLSLYLIFFLSPLKGFLTLISSFVILLYGSVLYLNHSHTVIPMATPLLSLFMNYYLLIPYRLILENKKSWIYKKENEILKRVEEHKTNFIKMMSHDLKTPLARIQGMSEILLKNKIQDRSSLEQEALTHIQSSTLELNQLIHSILDVHRIESQSLLLRLESHDLNRIILQQIERLSFLAKEKKIQIKKDLETLFSIQIDKDLIGQILYNLILNGLQYSPQEGVLFIRSYEKESWVYVDIEDHGPGIPLEDQPCIFQKFYRSKMSENLSLKGHGIGLYLSHYFAQRHKGTLSFVSYPKEKTIFTLKIPTKLDTSSSESRSHVHV